MSELPPVVRPRSGRDLASFLAAEREETEKALVRCGALLFRGFDVPDAPAFEAAARALGDGLVVDYPELPRAEGATYRTTPYPPREAIPFHNEGAHRGSFPRRQWFLCERPAEHGGETPLADGRRLLAALPEPLARALRERGVQYVRGFVEGFDVPWQRLFRTSDREVVELRCREDGAEVEWRDGAPRLRQRRPAVVRHPITGEEVLFGQILLHHPAFLPAEARRHLTRRHGAGGLPRDLLWGDGEPMDDATARQIGEAYRRVEVAFPWEAGDVLLLDNVLVAHARRPYAGPRSLRVVLGAELRLSFTEAFRPDGPGDGAEAPASAVRS